MELILCKNYEDMSERGANIIARAMIDKPDCILGLATGSTPVGMYKRLIEMNRADGLIFPEQPPSTSTNIILFPPKIHRATVTL